VFSNTFPLLRFSRRSGYFMRPVRYRRGRVALRNDSDMFPERRTSIRTFSPARAQCGSRVILYHYISVCRTECCCRAAPARLFGYFAHGYSRTSQHCADVKKLFSIWQRQRGVVWTCSRTAALSVNLLLPKAPFPYLYSHFRRFLLTPAEHRVIQQQNIVVGISGKLQVYCPVVCDI
jgi:hypothetical protein